MFDCSTDSSLSVRLSVCLYMCLEDAPALEDGDAEALARMHVSRIPGLLAAEHQAGVLEPQRFVFPCGDEQLTISLDGFSHSSGKRRCFAECPWKNHGTLILKDRCRKYVHLSDYDEQWMAVAHILLHMRSGVLASDKREHMRFKKPSNDELESVHDEMPAILFAGLPDAV